jgi:tetratricopeptide (TPR) repeat protein
MQEHRDSEKDFSFYSYFVPFTTKKAIICIIIIGLIIYFNIVFNGFVLDDQSYIIFNPELHSLNLSTLFGKNVFSTLSTGQYDPIPAIYFATLYNIFNNSSFFYHFFQVALQITNACLVFILLKRFFNKNLAFILSLVFLVHPIQEEAVAYISATGIQLFFLFGITSLLVLKNKFTSKRISILFILSMLSILSKETGILFLLILLIYAFLFKLRELPKLIVLESIVVFLYLFMRFVVGGIYISKIANANVPIVNLSLSERLLNVPAIIFYYIKTFVFPLSLATNQLWVIQSVSLTNFYLPLVIDTIFLSCILLLGFYLYKKKRNILPVYFFFLSWLLLGFALHIQIIPLDFTVADRYFYFPMVGILGLIGLCVISFKQNKSLLKASYIIIVIYLCVLSIRTMVRNTNWIDALSLLSHDSTISDNFVAENDIGTQYALIGNNTLALSHFQKSVAMHPYESNLYEEAFMYEHLGNPTKAEEFYISALNQKEPYSLSHYHNMSVYFDYGKFLLDTDPQKAITILNRGLSDYPNDGNLLILLALSEYRLHDNTKALSAVAKANSILQNAETEFMYSKISNKGTMEIKNYNGITYTIGVKH